MTPAGWWTRVGASLLDGILQTIAFVALLLTLSIDGVPEIALIFVGIGLVAVYLLYQPLMIAFNHGRTIGKGAAGIRVVNAGGAPTGLGRAFVRETVKTIFNLTGVLWILSVLWPLWEKDDRALHDLLVGTRVIGEPVERVEGA